MNSTTNDPIAVTDEPFTAQSLMDQARQEAGLQDYGEFPFVEALDRLVGAVQAEGGLIDMGLMGFRMMVVDRLKNRLRFQNDLAKHPEILDEDVSDPIFIGGLTRTGTTKLQRMMALDEQVQALPLWQCLNPAPFTGTLGVEPDPRIAVAKANADAFKQASPEFMSAHSWSEEEAEEHCLLLAHSFQTTTDGYFYDIPSYISWLWNQRPLTAAYADLRRWFQYLQWQNGGKGGRPWASKSPTDLGMLDEVLSTFPNATIVQCHRDPTVAIPSLCRLIEAGLTSRGKPEVDPLAIGRFFAEHSPRMWSSQLEQLPRWTGKADIINIDYDRIVNDAIGVVREIYASRGMSLSDETAARMAAWEQQNPRHKMGPHVYTLERYGLDRDAILREFEAYFDYYPAARPA